MASGSGSDRNWLRSAIFLYSIFISINASSQIKTAEFKPGFIIDTVKCIDDSSQSYALYLPSGYDAKKRWPVVYMFEPGARGALPLQNFSKAAEKYGYILLCSNNSKNGPWDPIFEAGNAMMNDSQKRFSIDTDRIYTSGFSGGARAASAVAVLIGKTAGVIGCGAGLARESKYQPGKDAGFTYVSLVGDCDMNWLEVNNLKKRLDELQIPNKLIIFSGTHEWPPEDAILKAFDWLELQAMKKGLETRSDTLIRSIYTNLIQKAQHNEKTGKFYESYRIYSDMIQDFDGLIDMTEINTKASELVELKSVKTAIRNEQDIADKETKQQMVCLEAIRNNTNNSLDSASAVWWKSEIKYLNGLVKNQDSTKSNMGKRLKQLIIYGCYEDGNTYKRNYQYQKAIAVHEILAIAMPDEKYPFFELAKEYAILGDLKESLKNLQKAVDNGYNDLDAINKEVAFEKIRTDDDFQKILNKIKPE
jgi:dienelactone hydrolase